MSRLIRLVAVAATTCAAVPSVVLAAPPPDLGGPPNAATPPTAPQQDAPPSAPAAPPATSGDQVQAPNTVEMPPPAVVPRAMPPFAALARTRFRVGSSGRVTLSFTCNGRFSATLKISRWTQMRSSDCPDGSAHLTYSLVSRVRRLLETHRSASGQLVIRRPGQPPVRRAITATRTDVKVISTPRPRTSARVRAAAATLWDRDQAELVCGDLNDPHRAAMQLKWHSRDGLTHGIYWQVWMQTWWEDPSGSVEGQYWKTPAGWGAGSSLYGPYREDALGIVELEQSVWSPFGGSTAVVQPWSWNERFPLGYHVWVKGWARLWVWTGNEWAQGTYPMRPSISATDAPDWCYYP